jgi:hypothetical protein
MRRHRHPLACSILSATSSIAIGCASSKPASDLSNRPSTTVAEAEYMQMVRIDPDMFQAPPGQIRVFTTTRAALDAARRQGDGSDFDNGANPLFYMGSDDDWDYYYLADHAFGMFYRVSRQHNIQDQRMSLTGDSLAWRELKAPVRAKRRP